MPEAALWVIKVCVHRIIDATYAQIRPTMYLVLQEKETD